MFKERLPTIDRTACSFDPQYEKKREIAEKKRTFQSDGETSHFDAIRHCSEHILDAVKEQIDGYLM